MNFMRFVIPVVRSKPTDFRVDAVEREGCACGPPQCGMFAQLALDQRNILS